MDPTSMHSARRIATPKPEVIKVAKAVMNAGWRVSSIIRPEGTHADGVSLDVCPLIYTRNGFGPRTAQLLWQLAKHTAPHAKWLSLAEPDHIHLQSCNVDIIGVQYPGMLRTWYSPTSLQKVPFNVSLISTP